MIWAWDSSLFTPTSFPFSRPPSQLPQSLHACPCFLCLVGQEVLSPTSFPTLDLFPSVCTDSSLILIVLSCFDTHLHVFFCNWLFIFPYEVLTFYRVFFSIRFFSLIYKSHGNNISSYWYATDFVVWYLLLICQLSALWCSSLNKKLYFECS